MTSHDHDTMYELTELTWDNKEWRNGNVWLQDAAAVTSALRKASFEDRLRVKFENWKSKRKTENNWK